MTRSGASVRPVRRRYAPIDPSLQVPAADQGRAAATIVERDVKVTFARAGEVDILTDARRQMYRLLANDDQVGTDEPGETA
jgi:hypothetical protein